MSELNRRGFLRGLDLAKLSPSHAHAGAELQSSSRRRVLTLGGKAGLVIASSAMIIPSTSLMALPSRESVLAGCFSEEVAFHERKTGCWNSYKIWLPKHKYPLGGAGARCEDTVAIQKLDYTRHSKLSAGQEGFDAIPKSRFFETQPRKV